MLLLCERLDRDDGPYLAHPAHRACPPQRVIEYDCPQAFVLEPEGLPCQCVSAVDHGDDLVRMRENSMIESLLDACKFVLEDQGEPQSVYWLASEIMEMKLWKANDADVRDALNKDIEKHGEQSQFVRLADDVFALRLWTEERVHED